MGKQLRKNYFIDKRIQGDFILRFCLFVVMATLAVTALAIVFTQDSTTVAIENARVHVKRTSDFIFPVMIQTCFIVSAASAIAVGAVLLFTTHRVVGPIYRMKKEIERLRDGDYNANFKLRSSDELQDLAGLLSELTQGLLNRQIAARAKAQEIDSALENKNFAAVDTLVQDLKKLL